MDLNAFKLKIKIIKNSWRPESQDYIPQSDPVFLSNHS